MIQPDLFSEAPASATPPPVVAPPSTKNVDKKLSRTAAHCRELARDGKKAGCSEEWCASYNAEADAIDAANGLMPLRQAQAVTEDVAALGKSEWQKFLAADPRRVMG